MPSVGATAFGAVIREPAVAAVRPRKAAVVSRRTAVIAALSTRGSPTPIAALAPRVTASYGGALAPAPTENGAIPAAASRTVSAAELSGPARNLTRIPAFSRIAQVPNLKTRTSAGKRVAVPSRSTSFTLPTLVTEGGAGHRADARRARRAASLRT